MNRSRRLFLGHLAAGLVAAAHPMSAVVGSETTRRPHPVRIRTLELVTSAPLDAMQAFYGDALGFDVARLERGIEVRASAWSLSFDQRPGVPAHYHFAFNIPENQIREAHDWARTRATLIRPPEHLRDVGLPADVVNFRHWNAHSVFFWDPAGNAVEFIARHTLSNASSRTFGPESALCISEIGLVVSDVESEAAKLRSRLGVDRYLGASSTFEPLGDEQGLLLVMKAGQPMAFGQGRERNPYPTSVGMDGRGPSTEVRLSGYPYVLKI